MSTANTDLTPDRLRVTGDGVWSSLDREGIRALGDSATR